MQTIKVSVAIVGINVLIGTATVEDASLTMVAMFVQVLMLVETAVWDKMVVPGAMEVYMEVITSEVGKISVAVGVNVTGLVSTIVTRGVAFKNWVDISTIVVGRIATTSAVAGMVYNCVVGTITISGYTWVAVATSVMI